MKKLALAICTLPFFLNCATHAPMSEMVMFNKSVEVDSLVDQHQTAITVFAHQPGKNRFVVEKRAEYNYEFTSGGFSVADVRLKSSRVGFSASFGTGTGLDITTKLINSWYGTVSVSALKTQNLNPLSSKDKFRAMPVFNYYASFQRVIFNQSKIGIAAGFFYQTDSREYQKRAYTCNGCRLTVTDYGIISLNSYGIKTTFLIRNKITNGRALNLNMKVSKLVEYDEFYVSAGFTFVPHIKNY